MTEITFNGRQKSAAIIVSLGSDIASKVYKYLTEDQIGILTYEIANLGVIESSQLGKIQRDFYELCYTQKIVAEGGIDVAKEILVKAFGLDAADKLIDKIERMNRPKLFEFLKKADSKSILNIIQHEHPQTIALILSYVRSKQASEVIAALPREKQIEVVERIAKMDKTHPEILAHVEKELEQKFRSVVSMDYEELGGVDYVADVINHMDRSSERYIFDELSKKDNELSEEIRAKMFVFEDIISLDSKSIQRFIRDVDSKDLILAIKGSTQEVIDILYDNMSKRNVQNIQTELEYTKNVRLKEIEESQQRIVDLIRRLDEEGELVISKGGEDDIIV